MHLNDEQKATIEALAALNWAPDKIALALGVNQNDFTELLNDSETEISFHYQRGLLQVTAKMDKSISDEAQKGSITAYQIFKKEAYYNKIENIKRRVLLQQTKDEYSQLKQHVNKGELAKTDPELEAYYQKLDFIRQLFNKNESRSFIINAVIKHFPDVKTDYMARKLYTETLNYFYLDNDVKVEAWNNIYADKLDRMATICFEMNDFETARRLNLDAARLRGCFKENLHKIPEELLERKIVIYTIHAKEVGIPEVDRRELAKIIDEWDISEREKYRAKRDAMITDVEFEFIEQDDKS